MEILYAQAFDDAGRKTTRIIDIQDIEYYWSYPYCCNHAPGLVVVRPRNFEGFGETITCTALVD
jgi:hypothetical protein